MDIVKLINSYGIKEADDILNKIFESDDINERMELCDELIDELLFNDIEIDDIEDEIRDLTLN